MLELILALPPGVLWGLAAVYTLMGLAAAHLAIRDRGPTSWAGRLPAIAMMVGLPLAAAVAGGWCGGAPEPPLQALCFVVPGLVASLARVANNALGSR